MYPKSVKFLGDYPHKVLKQSKNKKLSKDKLPVIKKGEFKGYVIYTLTLEERATCPRECYHWDDCYEPAMVKTGGGLWCPKCYLKKQGNKIKTLDHGGYYP